MTSDRFTDEDLDPIDLGGWIHWTPPAALRRVAWYVVDLAVDAAGPLDAQQRSQIGSQGGHGGHGDVHPSNCRWLRYVQLGLGILGCATRTSTAMW